MGLFPNGEKVFEVISRYDDLLTMEGREDYEPGDTLALIVPFLLLRGINENAITTLEGRATLTKGVENLILGLTAGGWQVFCITTTYEQYARRVTEKLGIERKNVACTPFPLDKLCQILCKLNSPLLEQLEKDILRMSEDKDDLVIKKKLDEFFCYKLPQTEIGKVIHTVKPIGGRRKVKALKEFCGKYNRQLSDWVYIGDSITDFRVLKEVNNARGLAIAFNANCYALPYATLSLASTHVSDLEEILSVWRKDGRSGVEALVRRIENMGGPSDRKQFHWLADKQDIDGIVGLHGKMRRKLRDRAGTLG